jgi:hypothetical protein
LDYSKSKNKFTNEIEMNMVKAITNLVDVMSIMLEGDQGKEIVFPK